jgi:hypothetical protein
MSEIPWDKLLLVVVILLVLGLLHQIYVWIERLIAAYECKCGVTKHIDDGVKKIINNMAKAKWSDGKSYLDHRVEERFEEMRSEVASQEVEGQEAGSSREDQL